MQRAFKYAASASVGDGAQMKIGEVSKLSGVGVEALRFYEKSGLLDRPGRTYSGYRAYGPEVLKRIAFIKQAQVLGFTLDEIRQLIAHKGNGESPCREVRAMVKNRLEELEERIAQMTRYREDLSAELAKWEEAEEVEGHVCGLIEGSTIEYGIDARAVKPSRKPR
jgi:DNA-binding transcriptional MerR regulator